MAQEGIENIRGRLNRLGVPQPVIDSHINAVAHGVPRIHRAAALVSSASMS
jgi:hypothetical protein